MTRFSFSAKNSSLAQITEPPRVRTARSGSRVKSSLPVNRLTGASWGRVPYYWYTAIRGGRVTSRAPVERRDRAEPRWSGPMHRPAARPR
ncbi:hypothetical protein ACFVJ5_23310 [Nocardia sp. NPDC127606]|uniref:hypothetical protein n=1 Tax=Nocardia sp. NPDC127606 TaxID=3345406 RepID=UPI003625990D